VRSAAHEVARPILMGVGIIIAVYVPIFSLQGLEGRMYRPMAVTVCAALLGSLVLTLTVVPAASRLLLGRRTKESNEPYMERVRDAYRRILNGVLDHRALVVTVGFLIVAVALGSLYFIGTEFMPRLDEGSVLVQTLRLPSISLTESVDIGLEVERTLMTFPEVTGVVSKLGRPDLATEAMGIYESDVYVNLKPHDEWTTASTKDGLTEAMAAKLAKVPGVVYNFTQPMAMRLDETISGVRADIAVKIFGPDERMLDRKADEVLRVLSRVRGAADAQKQMFSGAAEWQVVVDRAELARYGLNVSDVRDVVQVAVGGKAVTEIVDGRRRFQVAVRFPESYRKDREALGSILLSAPAGEQVPLQRVAEIRRASGPEVVFREDSQRRIVVQCNVRGRDMGSFVAEAEQRIQEAVDLPTGYYIDWGGQFENQQRAMQRLLLVLPAVLLVIFMLLFLTFQSAKQSLLVLFIVPFATVGGIAGLWLRGMNLNVSASIGFIAVFGVAVLDGLVMVSLSNSLLGRGLPLREAIVEGAVTRLRPVLMTSVLASLGFLPMAVATSIGAEVQRPLATVVIGGLVSSTILTLLLLPALYSWFLPKSRIPDLEQP
jgi:cobalt-zinc-cadmium resistance protein CzcA